MILESLQLPELKNFTCNETGIDSLQNCRDKKHFKNFPHDVNYLYNDRGFRDDVWPNSLLEEAIWCVGDSFTVGLGSPFQHTWPQVLQQKTNRKTITVAMDGASNQWINRKVKTILKEVKPKNIVIMWSYTHRRELPDESLTDMQRRVWLPLDADGQVDYIDFKSCILDVCQNAGNTNLIHLAIPKFLNNMNSYPVVLNKIKNFLGPVEVIDYARDCHHFDILTSTQVVNKIIPLLST